MRLTKQIISGLRKGTLVFLLLATSFLCSAKEVIPEISIITDQHPGKAVRYALDKLMQTLDAGGISYERVAYAEEARGRTILAMGLSRSDGLAAQLLKKGGHKVPEVPEALTIRKTQTSNRETWVLSGFDEVGLMYGILDFSERIGWTTRPDSPFSEIREITESPDVKERAISMYTMNRAYWESRFYDEGYWTHYLDMLVRNRFNRLTLIFGYENGGFLAPCYPYFFAVDEFPGICMEGMGQEEQEKNLNALNRLIELAHERGIRFSVGLWDHIYRGGVQRGGISEEEEEAGGFERHRVRGLNNDNLIPYTLLALENLIKRVPRLDGIQFRIHNESGLKRGEQDEFWRHVFQHMKRTAPHLQFDLRAKGLPESVIQSAMDAGIDFRIATKYWMEQMGMPFHPSHINRQNQFDRRHGYADLLRYPQDYTLYWRLWTGGTTRILLWGDPEYVRRFAASTHLYNSNSYEVNEPLATKMETRPHDEKPFELLKPEYRYYQYEFERYWHFFQVFGRIGYNPETSPEIWQKEFQLRFGTEAAPLLEEALHKASWILPRIVASCYPYACFPTTRGWAEKQRLGDLPHYALAEGSDIQQFASFDEEARIRIEGGETAKVLPSENSQWFMQVAADIHELTEEAMKAPGAPGNKEFVSTLTDLKILSNLALYHSRRIPAAVSYRIFKHNGNASALEDAIEYERSAMEAWKKLVGSAGEVYAFDLKMGVREAEYMDIIHHQSGHWKDELLYLEEGLKDLEQEYSELDKPGKEERSLILQTSSQAKKKPAISISHQPITEIQADKPLFIKVKIESPVGIKWVKLRFRSVNQMREYQEMQMLPNGSKDTYQVRIEAGQIDPQWDFMYFFEVMDRTGSGSIYPDLNLETPYIISKVNRRISEEGFTKPHAKYRPIPFWHMNGKLNNDSILQQIEDAAAAGFGGIAPVAVTEAYSFNGENLCPGTDPEYFSEAYFEHYELILKKIREIGLQHILYDDLDFPSGIAGGKMRERYPKDIRKILYKNEYPVNKGSHLKMDMPPGQTMAVIAMEKESLQIINLKDHVFDGELTWTVPEKGNWKVLAFTARVNPSKGKPGNMDVVDYLDPVAVEKYIALGYDPYTSHFESYYGSTISQLFFDDVGFYTGNPEGERTWTYGFNRKFKELTGREPDTYYPALWEDIGEDTDAARVAFFNTRAELLAEGFLRKVSDWGKKNGLKVSGHAPDNYNIQPVHMSADPFKYYRYQDIPTVNLIFDPERGRDGFKVVSSVANSYHKPVVAAEIFGAFPEVDKQLIYNASMELFVRGVNQLIPHGMWYDYRSSSIRIPPLIAPYNPDIGSELPAFNRWASRCSYLLQGGDLVADIAIIYPIASLEASYRFGRYENWQGHPPEVEVPGEIDYFSTGHLLTNKLHRDFTYLHPEDFSSDQIQVQDDMLEQTSGIELQYKLLILPGGQVISVKVLEKLKKYSESGGCIIASSMLPSKSAEFGKNAAVVSLVKELFGIDPTSPMPDLPSTLRENEKGGKILFIPEPDQQSLAGALSAMKLNADVYFHNIPVTEEDGVSVSYIHKVNEGRDIYYFINSGRQDLETEVDLRGRLDPEIWDPHTGEISGVKNIRYTDINGQTYTHLTLKMDASRSQFIISKQNRSSYE